MDVFDYINRNDLDSLSKILYFNCNKKFILDGDTPLLYAIRLGKIEIVKYLLEQDFRDNIVDKNDDLGVVIAVKTNNLEIFKMLYNGYDLSSLFKICILHNFNELGIYLIDLGLKFDNLIDDFNYPINYVCENGNEVLFKKIMTKGARLNPGNYCDSTFTIACYSGNRNLILQFIKFGYDINSIYNGCTALENMYYYNKYEMFSFLILLGANIDIKCESGETLFERMCINEDIDFIKCMLQSGYIMSDDEFRIGFNIDVNELQDILLEKKYVRRK